MPRAGIFGSARVSADGPFVEGYQGRAANTSGGTVYTFPNRPIGAASATRLVVVAVTNRLVGPPTSVTVGGIEAALDASILNLQAASIWSASVPTGDVADIVVTHAASGQYCGIGHWSLNDRVKAVSSSTFDHTNGVTAVDLSLAATEPGDFVIATLAYRTSADSGLVAWGGLDERFDLAITSGSVRQASAADGIATGTSVGITATVTNNDEAAGVAVAYR